MQSREQATRARIVASLILCAIAIVLLAIAVKDPRTYGVGVLCPSLRWFGLYCPGCGSTRATYFLLHADVESAIRHNPLLVFVGVPVLMWLMFTLASSMFWARKPIIFSPRWFAWAVAIALVSYGIVRNIPIHALENLRPPQVEDRISNPIADFQLRS